MRQFGIIATSLWRSKRFRALSTDLARLTYIYLHTSPHGNSVGAFVLPPELAALDMKRDAEDVRLALAELVEAHLIRHDPDEELVQIVNFFRFNSPSSRKQLAGPVRIVRDNLPASWVRDATAADLVVAMYNRAQTWEKTVEARGAFLDEAARLVKDMQLKTALCGQYAGEIDLLIGLSEALLIELPIERHYQRHYQHTETDIQTQTHTETQTERGSGGEVPRSAPPSPPADSGRSGRKPDEATQRAIAELTARAKGAK